MRVVPATAADIPPWLELAAEVEFLFGSLVEDTRFRQALRKNLERGQCWCVREDSDQPGAPLAGATIFDEREVPIYRISWLAVAKHWQRRGVGRDLVEHCFARATPPAEIRVVTFGSSVPGGMPARSFYEALGFTAWKPGSGQTLEPFREELRRLLT